jgi:hypothetical protein
MSRNIYRQAGKQLAWFFPICGEQSSCGNLPALFGFLRTKRDKRVAQLKHGVLYSAGKNSGYRGLAGDYALLLQKSDYVGLIESSLNQFGRCFFGGHVSIHLCISERDYAPVYILAQYTSVYFLSVLF